MFVTWKHQHTDFTYPLKLEDKVTIFREKVWGWQLHIAELCLDGGKDHEGKKDIAAIPHSAFGAMQIMLAYFEMIAKYEDGFIPTNPKQGKSAEYFKRGVKSVFPELSSHSNQSDVDSFLEMFYEKARCGLYHTAQSEAGIVLSGDLPSVMIFDLTHKHLYINPHRLPAKLKYHLTDYTQRLEVKENADLRDKFKKRFDYDNESLVAPGVGSA